MDVVESKGIEPASDILKRIFSGALRAAKVFDRATGGCRLSDASEHFLTAGIFEALSKCKGATHLEVSVKACRKEAGAIRCGKPSAADRMSGRYDLVHYRVDQRPRIAIEVKNGIKVLDKNLFTGDFGRLTRALSASRSSTYQFCAFVFFATTDYRGDGGRKHRRKDARDRLGKLIDRVSGLAAEFVSRERGLIRRTYRSNTYFSPHDDEGAWAIGIVVFAGKNSVASFPEDLLERLSRN